MTLKRLIDLPGVRDLEHAGQVDQALEGHSFNSRQVRGSA